MSPVAGRLKVLVADDDPLARSLVAASLARMNTDVVEVGDGEAAWVELRKGDFAAAFLDLEMPGFDGFEIISCVRGHPLTKHIPIVVMTARDDKRAIDRAQQLGATSYITKPVHWSAFRNHIGYLLDLMRKAPVAPVAAAPASGGMQAERHAVVLARAARRLEAVRAAIGQGPAGSVPDGALAELHEIEGQLLSLAVELAPAAPPRRPEREEASALRMAVGV